MNVCILQSSSRVDVASLLLVRLQYYCLILHRTIMRQVLYTIYMLTRIDTWSQLWANFCTGQLTDSTTVSRDLGANLFVGVYTATSHPSSTCGWKELLKHLKYSRSTLIIVCTIRCFSYSSLSTVAVFVFNKLSTWCHGRASKSVDMTTNLLILHQMASFVEYVTFLVEILFWASAVDIIFVNLV